MRLFVDIGNTRLKWGAERSGTWCATGAVTHAGNLENVLERVFTGLEVPERVVAASVAGAEAERALAVWVRSAWDREVEYLRPTASVCGVTNAYAEPYRLGADRWAALIGARALGEEACCVVDCGSAATFDALDACGRHLGGLIVPGLGLMRRSLAQGTSLLPLVDEATASLFGRDTASAIAGGTLLGLAKMVDGLAAGMRRDIGLPLRLLLTGGDGAWLQDHVQEPFVYRPHLVLEGLVVYADASRR